MGIILIVTLLFAQNSYSFGIFFGGNDDEQSKVLTATAEVLDNIATYKAETRSVHVKVTDAFSFCSTYSDFFRSFAKHRF